MPLHLHRIKMPGSKKSQMAKNSKESGIITDKSLALNAVITWTKLVSAREAGFSTDHPLCCKITAMVKNRGMQPESRWAWYCDFHAALVTGPAATTNRGLYSAVQAEAVSPACHQLLTSPLPQIKHNRRLHVYCSVTGFHHQLHTQTRSTAPCPGLPRWAGTGKVKPIWILLKQETVSGSGIRWAICKSAPCSRQKTMPVPHHLVFLLAGCPSCHPTNSIKALKVITMKQLPVKWIENKTARIENSNKI